MKHYRRVPRIMSIRDRIRVFRRRSPESSRSKDIQDERRQTRGEGSFTSDTPPSPVMHHRGSSGTEC